MLNLRRPFKSQPAYTPLPNEAYVYNAPQKASFDSFALSALTGGGIIGRNRDFAPGDQGAALAAVAVEDVYACIGARVQAMDGLSWQIRRIQGNTPAEDDPIVASREDVIPRHPFAFALRQFRVEYKFSLFHIWYYCKLVTGKAFIQPLQNIARAYTGLEWYNPTAVMIEAPLGVITRFQYTGRGEILNFLPDQLVYDYYVNLVDEVEGQSPVEVTIDRLNIDRNMKRTLNAYFRNGMRLGAIISPTNEGKGYWSQQDIERLIQEMKDNHKGTDNSYNNIYLPYGVSVDYPAQQRYEHLDSVADRNSKTIHKTLRVPASITGDMSETRYKEHKDMYDAWVSLVVLPDARDIRDVVNTHLMPKFDPSGETYFTFDESEWSGRVTQAELDKRETAKIDLETGAITIREYNERLGIPMTEDDAQELDVRFIDASKLVVKRGQLGQVNPNPAIPPEDNVQIVEAEMQAEQETPLLSASVNTVKEGTKSACVLLKLADNPDLVSLRKRVEDHLAGIETEWNDPSSYHVTLAYAPAVSDEQIQTLAALMEEVNLPELDLNIGSLNTFDDMGRYAVHFRIRKNGALIALHQRIIDLCRDASIPLSTYSDPANYIPHITMGYTAQKPKAITYQTKITVKADTLQVTGDDYEVLYETVSDAEKRKAIQDDAEAELKAWYNFAQKPQKRAFEFNAVRGDVEHYIKSFALGDTPDLDAFLKEFAPADTHAIYKAAVRRIAFNKAIGATREEFMNAVRLVIDEARKGNITRVRFGNILRDIVKRFGRLAFIDGLVDAGIPGGEMDEDDYETVADLTRQQSEYVTGLGDVLFKQGGISDEEAKQKPLLWWNKTLKGFYDEGLISGNSNQMLEFTGQDGSESCITCMTLKGQRHRAKDWKKARLRPGIDGDNFVCGLWQCEHILIPTTNKESGTLPSEAQIAAWVAKKSTHIHEAHEIDFSQQSYTKAQHEMYHLTQGYTDMLEMEDVA